MAAYKSDINLFKAAGGERAKSKQVSKTKRLLIVVVIVVVLVAAVAGFLIYYSGNVEGQLKKLTDQKASYEATATRTRAGLETLDDVNKQIATQNAIEFAYTSNMLTPGMYSDMSTEELLALRSYLRTESTGYTFEYTYDEVIDDILSRLNLVSYDDNATDEYSARFLYNALYYMKTMQPVFSMLPLQYDEEDTELYYWYCYYRGKVIMLLKGGETHVDATTFINNLRTQLGYAPFSTIAPQGSEDLTAMSYSVSLQGTTYLAVALNSKTVVERFVDTVEATFGEHSLQDLTTVSYQYTASDFALIETETAGVSTMLFHVTFGMSQSEYFHLTDVCNALYATPFFEVHPKYSFTENDSDDAITGVNLVLVLENKAVEAIHEAALGYFIVEE